MLALLGAGLVFHNVGARFRDFHPRLYWSLCSAFILGDVLSSMLLVIGATAYKYLDHSDWKRLWVECKHRKWRFLLCLVPVPLLVASYALFEPHWSESYAHLYYLLGYVSEVMVLTIMGNIWLLSQKRVLARRTQGKDTNNDSALSGQEVIDKGQEWILRVAAATVLYIVSVLGFTRLVYPYIPAAKAGGSYDDKTREVAVTMMLQSPIGVCTTIPTNTTYILLEESGSWVYLANGKKPDQWGRLAGNGTIFRPETIYAVNRNCIAYTSSAK